MNRPALIIILSALAAAPLAPVAAQDLLWTQQAGTSTSEFCYGVAVDGPGNAYIVGTTDGSFGGPNAGVYDVFLVKFNSSGTLLWTRQIGSDANDQSSKVAVDGVGNVYITGSTNGNLGGPNAGNYDAFLAKYDATGTLLWTRQTGTLGSDFSYSVAVEAAGNAYICGYTDGDFGGGNAGMTDLFLSKFDPSGTLLWTRQHGTPALEISTAVAVGGDSGVYIVGTTLGSFAGTNAGGADAFLVKYNSSGTLLWTRQIGTTMNDSFQGVVVDGAGNLYMTGETAGSLGGPNAGGVDALLAKFSASGTLLWTRQIGTPDFDKGLGAAVDGAGSAYVAGLTEGSLGGPNAGGQDAMLVKYDAWGTLLWTRQTGSAVADEATGVAVDGAGGVYVAGYTEGDAFLAKYGRYDPPLCPADFNHDGFVTGDDFDSFVAAFEAGTSNADFDGDTFVTGDDFDAYVAAFEAGC